MTALRPNKFIPTDKFKCITTSSPNWVKDPNQAKCVHSGLLSAKYGSTKSGFFYYPCIYKCITADN